MLCSSRWPRRSQVSATLGRPRSPSFSLVLRAQFPSLHATKAHCYTFYPLEQSKHLAHQELVFSRPLRGSAGRARAREREESEGEGEGERVFNSNKTFAETTIQLTEEWFLVSAASNPPHEQHDDVCNNVESVNVQRAAEHILSVQRLREYRS